MPERRRPRVPIADRVSCRTDSLHTVPIADFDVVSESLAEHFVAEPHIELVISQPLAEHFVSVTVDELAGTLTLDHPDLVVTITVADEDDTYAHSLAVDLFSDSFVDSADVIEQSASTI